MDLGTHKLSTRLANTWGLLSRVGLRDGHEQFSTLCPQATGMAPGFDKLRSHALSFNCSFPFFF